MLKYTAICLLCSIVFQAGAQTEALDNWGVVPAEYLRMESYAEDTSANAILLLNKGSYKLMQAQNRHDCTFYTTYEYHKKLKVLNDKALDEGNLSIRYYAKRRKNTLNQLEIVVHYPDGRKENISTKQSFDESLGDGEFLKKIFIPNVQKGVVIEYRYAIEITDDIIERPFYMQGDLPCIRSVFDAEINDVFDYDIISRMSSEPDEFAMQKRDKTYSRHIVLSNIPAVKDEPFCRSIADLTSRVEFRIKGLKLKEGDDNEQTWASLVRKLKTDEFQKKLKKSRFNDDLVKAFEVLPKDGLDLMAKIKLAQTFVATQIEWDGSYYSDEDVNQALAEKKGSYNQLSYALLACLKSMEIECYPAFVRTRSRGLVWKDYAYLGQFNAVAVWVKIGELGLFVDATDAGYQLGDLDDELYNDAAWVLYGKEGTWLDMKAAELKDVGQYKLAIQADGSLKGAATLNVTGPLIPSYLEYLKAKQYDEFVKAYFLETFEGMTVNNLTYDVQLGALKPMKIDIEFEVPNWAVVSGDFMYLPTLPASFFEQNPFTAQKRLYDISMVYPVRNQVIATYQLPEGYVLEELPKPSVVKVGEKDMNFTILSSQPDPASVQISFKVNINQTEYSAADYSSVKNFFDLVASKAQEQMVLKKRN